MELIKITTNENGEQLVSGRELHKFLEATERYSNWFERMMKYGFTENVDFVGCKVFNALANQELQDHAMTLDMAKEISMIQRTEKGKQARQYFIQAEKDFKESRLKLPTTTREVMQLLLKNGEEANERIDKVEEDIKQLKEEAKLDTGDYNVITTRVKKRVYEVARAYGWANNKEAISALFKDINSGIKRIAHVEARTQLQVKHYDQVIGFINDWEPSVATRYELKQTKLDV